MTTKLDQSVGQTNQVPAGWASPRRAPQDAVVDLPAEQPRGRGWTVVTTLGVLVVAGVGAATTARVGAIALAVLAVGFAVVRAAVEPGPTALSVRSRRTDVLMLSLLAIALGAVATQLPVS